MRSNKKNIVILIMLLIWCSGCAPLMAALGVFTEGVFHKDSMIEATEVNRANLKNIAIGISKRYTIKTMGTDPIWAYKNREALEIPNPYKTEILRSENQIFEVIYYVTDVKDNELSITDDELTPIVFKNNVLVGWGWPYLSENFQIFRITYN